MQRITVKLGSEGKISDFHVKKSVCGTEMCWHLELHIGCYFKRLSRHYLGLVNQMISEAP